MQEKTHSGSHTTSWTPHRGEVSEREVFLYHSDANEVFNRRPVAAEDITGETPRTSLGDRDLRTDPADPDLFRP